MVSMLLLHKNSFRPIFWLFILVLSLSACSSDNTPTAVDTPTLELLAPTETFIQPTPTPTPLPAAAVVNGEPISLAFFQNEVDRYLLAQESLGKPVNDEALVREIVLNDLINQVLLGQAAQEAGIEVNDADVQARIDALAAEVDLAAWMSEWGYSEEDLFESLRLQLLASHQRDRLVDLVPEITEQVELRQVLALTQAGAERALLSLNSGAAFEQVASEYDRRNTGGYLGWVPRGYLLFPAIEEVVFDLPVGSYSTIIETEIGYHIVMVVSREERVLTHDARLTLQRNTLETWLADQRESSTIVWLID